MSEGAVRYYLKEDFLGGETFEINESQYETLERALNTIISFIDIEESFQVFARSFIRFEKDSLDIAFEYAYSDKGSGLDVFFFDSVRSRFNVNVITILTSYKSYDDHCSKILKNLKTLSDAIQFNEKIRVNYYNTHLSYRICARLRDYAQHGALPLGGFSIGGNANFARNDTGQLIKLDTGFNVSPWLDVKKFTDSSHCKADLRRELTSLAFEKIDMKWLIRSFASVMYKRHCELREYLKPHINFSLNKILDGYKFAGSLKKSEASFLVLCSSSRSINMRNDLGDFVNRMFSENKSLNRAENIFITSKINHQEKIYSGSSD